MLKRILVVCLISLISACGSSNKEDTVDTNSFEYKGNWGRAFLLYDEDGQASCTKEITTITEDTWKLFQFIYSDEACETFYLQMEFVGDIATENSDVVDGLAVKKMYIENVDWVAMGVIEPFYEPPNDQDKDIIFAISKGILWDGFKVETFELNLFQDGELFFSNIFTAFLLSNTPSLVVDGNSINLDSGYIKIESITKEQVDKLEL